MFNALIVQILLKQGLIGTPAIKPATLIGQQFARVPMADATVVQNADQSLALLIMA